VKSPPIGQVSHGGKCNRRRDDWPIEA
jgi:hypothetical protein